MKSHVFVRWPIAVLVLFFITAPIALYTGYKFASQDLSWSDTTTPTTFEPSSTGVGEPANPSQRVLDEYGRLPIVFVPNAGQEIQAVKFQAHGHRYSLFLTGEGAVFSLRPGTADQQQETVTNLRIMFDGMRPDSKPVGLEDAGGRTNFLVGNDRAGWRKDLPNYRKVKYNNIYSGVDLVYYGNGQQLEYDYHVRSGSDPRQIKMRIEGATGAQIDENTGDLVLHTEGGTLKQLKPFAYQDGQEGRQEIAAAYAVSKSGDAFTVSFTVGEYDRSRELVIDPVLAYGSFLGGNAFDEGRSIAIDQQGNAYVAGTTASRNFPTMAGTVKPAMLPRSDAPNSYWNDAFVTKINPTGTTVLFSTYFGGRDGNEGASGIALDAAGNIILAGTTMSPDLPTVNAFQATFGGTDDAFLAKLNPTGSAILYSTYLGGNNTDLGGKIAVNRATGDVVVGGYASSPDFRTTPGAYKERLCSTPQGCSGIFFYGSYIAKFSANGNVIYSTLFNGGVNDVALDPADNAVLGGEAGITFPTTPGAFQPTSSGGIDGLIAKLNPAGSSLVFSTFLGGGLHSDRVKSIAVDAAGEIYVTGETENAAFPTTAGAFDQTYSGTKDGFVSKLRADGSALVYSTFIGGPAKDEPFSIALSSSGDAFVAGETLSGAGFPQKNSLNGPLGSIFLLRLNAAGTGLVHSSLLGYGGAYDVAVDAVDNAYITGHANAIPVTPDAFQPMRSLPDDNSTKDAFVMKIAAADENAATYSISGTVNDSMQFGNYAPIVVKLTGTVSRSVILTYGNGSGIVPYHFGNLPAGGTYTVRASKLGFETDPENVAFSNLGANQFADFTILPNQRPQGVVVSPTHGTSFSAPASINIQATASDPDGDPISKVDFVGYHNDLGVVTIGTDATAPYEITWGEVPAGTWSISAIPTDSKGLRGESTPVVHVFVNDSSPVSVSITGPANSQTFVEGDTVPIAVNVSSSVNLVEVRNQSGELVGRMTGSPWRSQWRVMDAGQYTLTATAFNSQGQSAVSAPVNISVNPINHRISGRIIDSVTQAGLPGVPVNLTSPTNPSITTSTTTDSTGHYFFSDLSTRPTDGVVIRPVLAGYTLSPETRNIAYLGWVDWPYQHFTAVPQTQISVDLTSPAAGQSFAAPATVELAASATSGAGAITKVEFFANRNGTTQLVGSDTAAPFQFQWTNVAEGIYGIFARATDSTGAVADSEGRNIYVSQQPSTIRLQGDISDPNGWRAGVTVRLTGTANGNNINQVSVSNHFGAYGFFNVPRGGSYTITPQANGVTFTPPSFSVTNATADNLDIDFVASSPNQPATVQINSPADGAVYTMPVAIPINATATDPDGQVTHFRLTADGNGRVATIGEVNNGNFNAPWQPTLPGAYKIWATARDSAGIQTSVSIDITVDPPPPVAISGRIVDRASAGLEGVTVELKEYPDGTAAVAAATTNANGEYVLQNVPTFRNYILTVNKLNYSFAPQYRLFFNLASGITNAGFTGTLQVQPSDFDGDSGSDFAVWRPSSGVWYVAGSSTPSFSASQFGYGSMGDVLVPGNYDGDDAIDHAVFRVPTWHIRTSSGSYSTREFGVQGDKPVPADYDGDGRTDLAVWRESEGAWYIQPSAGGGGHYKVQFGAAGDKPIAGDYDADGRSDITVWRPSTGTWYTLNSFDGSWSVVRFGEAGDIPVVGDFNNDERSDIAVFRPSTGVWYTQFGEHGGFRIVNWGEPGDKPVVGDYDKDGMSDYAVFRPSNGQWYLRLSRTNSFAVRQFGIEEDIPIPAAFNP